MRIAVVGHVRHPIRAPFAGGLEAHTWHLASELERRGHEVTLFASGDSDPRFRITPIVGKHFELEFPGLEHRQDRRLQDHLDAGYAKTCRMLTHQAFDVVHNNSLHRFVLQGAYTDKLASVSSLHTPPIGGLEWFVRSSIAPWHWFSAVSRVQQGLWWPGEPPAESVVVPNGIDVSCWPFVAEGGGTAVWSGRITRDKGTHLAAQAARLAEVPLLVLGMIEDQAYFEEDVAPLLGEIVSYGGHLAGEALAAAIGRASVFLSTPCWPEPFGLGAIEAMACGVPVAAFDLGAVREVVGELTGRYAVAGDVPGMVRAMRSAMELDRTAARRRVVERFAIDSMTDSYEELYRAARLGCQKV